MKTHISPRSRAGSQTLSFFQQTGWTPEDAIAMAFEARTDLRLFGNRAGNKPTRLTSAPNAGRKVLMRRSQLEEQTGWTPEAAMAMAFEARSDRRLFGNSAAR